MNIKIVNKSKHSLPEYATKGSAGMDLKANLDEFVWLNPQERVLIPTGIYIELPEGYEAQIRSKSGKTLKKGMVVLNSPGTVDSDYRKEVGVIIYNASIEPFTINDGDSIAQMVIAKHETAEWILVEELENNTDRVGGFGSTGK